MNPQPVNPLAQFIATTAQVGSIPKAPGTFGSIFAVALFVVIWDALAIRYNFITSIGMFTAITIFTYLIGAWATKVYMEQTGKQDPKEVVIDEVAGVFVTMLLTLPFYSALNEFQLVVLFVLFRLFDIKKPWLVGTIDKNMKGTHGVMLDDVVAGAYAALSFVIGMAVWNLIS